MASNRRIAALERDLQLAETAYEERLRDALRRCADGYWGLFGVNDAVVDAHFGRSGERHKSTDAADLLARGAEIAERRSRLGYVEVFATHERFMWYRKTARFPNAPGEPKLAQQFIDEMEEREGKGEPCA